MIIFTEMNKTTYYTISNEKCIEFLNKFRNFILNNHTYNYDYNYHEYKQFTDYYIIYSYYENVLFSIRYCNYSCKIHKVNGPAWITYVENGKIFKKEYYLNDNMYSYEEYLLEINKLV